MADDWRPARHSTLWLPGGLTGFVHEHADGRWRGVAVRDTVALPAGGWYAEPGDAAPAGGLGGPVFEVFGATQTEAEMRLMTKAEDWA
jgi:hypothetical protein